jgi:hypothetical protein
MTHYFSDVPGLGAVAVSRHAQAKAQTDGITDAMFTKVLLHGETVPEGNDVVWRVGDGIRIVILRRPEPFKGAALVKTVFREEEQARIKK